MRLLGITLLSIAYTAVAAEPPRLYADVATNGREIAFVFSGQLWNVPVTGGAAHLVNRTPAEYRGLVYSPDGTSLAYAKLADGEAHAYVLKDGVERQVTFHPKGGSPRAWSPDGKSLVFMSSREIDGNVELYTVTPGQSVERRMPIPRAVQGSYSPDGKYFVFADSPYSSVITRRFYRGGDAKLLTRLDLQTLNEKTLGAKGAANTHPMFIDGKLYFLEDSKGSFNLAVYDFGKDAYTELTSFATKGITSAGGGGGAVVFVRDGRIHFYDTTTSADHEVAISFTPEDLKIIDETQPKSVQLDRNLQSANLSWDGKMLALESRGDVVTKDLPSGVVTVHTKSSGAAERIPTISRDGKRLAYFSDESGEYALHIRDIATGNVSRIPIEKAPTYYRELTWSPDGQRVCFSDIHLNLWSAELASSSCRKVDTSEYMTQDIYHPTWSPDGRYLAYAKSQPNGIKQIIVWDPATGKKFTISDPTLMSEFPTFDPTGTYLYFTTSWNARNAPARDLWALQSSMFAEPLVQKFVTVATLRDPLSDTVDFGSIGRRIRVITASARDIIDLRATAKGVAILFQEWNSWTNSTAYVALADPNSKTAPTKMGPVDSMDVSGDGTTLLLFRGRAVSVASTADGKETQVDLTKDSLEVNPRAEWSQMFHEAFRMMRDNFYDANYHGQNVKELENHYAEYLPSLQRRGDLNSLLTLAFGEISISHLRVSGGDQRPSGGRPARTGTLGADIALEGNRFVIKRIIPSGDYAHPGDIYRSPLDAPGVNVYEGDSIVKIEGEELSPTRSIYSYLIGKAGRPTKVAVRTGNGPEREYTVTPLAGENTLRTNDWVRRNEEQVRKLSGGKLTYVFIPGYGEEGYANFAKVMNSSQDKSGLIIDQRFNGGGITSDAMIAQLLTPPMLRYYYRFGGLFTVPYNRIDGPKVLITNESNGSAAETFASMYKSQKVGKIVGWRTFGAGIGTALFQQNLIDGGVIAIPNRAAFNPLTLQWEIENEGVHPDFPVQNSCKDFVAGRDAQLEAAVKVAMDELRTYKKPLMPAPKPPVHPGGNRA